MIDGTLQIAYVTAEVRSNLGPQDFQIKILSCFVKGRMCTTRSNDGWLGRAPAYLPKAVACRLKHQKSALRSSRCKAPARTLRGPKQIQRGADNVFFHADETWERFPPERVLRKKHIVCLS